MIESYSETWNKIQKKNKNLLFDLNATQPQNAIEKKHGGSEYTKVVFKSLVKSADKKNITIDAVYNPKVELDKNIFDDCKKHHINLLPINNKKDIKPYLDYIISEHKKRNPRINVVDSYIGLKKELVQKGENRNYLYHINKHFIGYWIFP